ncbi:MAG: STAS domain-containing protein [Endozoicomonas sp.]
MSIIKVESGKFELSGEITFDSSPSIVTKGEKVLADDDAEHWEVDLTNVQRVDSSALSVLFAWIRLAQKHKKVICFSNIPNELDALATVCGLNNVINSVTSTKKSAVK